MILVTIITLAFSTDLFSGYLFLLFNCRLSTEKVSVDNGLLTCFFSFSQHVNVYVCKVFIQMYYIEDII